MELTVHFDGIRRFPEPDIQVHMHSESGDRPVNQDATAYLECGEWLVCVLADGAGGHQGGEVAAHEATQRFLELFRTSPTSNPARLLGFMHETNSHILHLQQANPPLADMHSTLSVLIINRPQRHAVWLHVGDSRIYHFRQDSLLTRTKDHSTRQLLMDQSGCLLQSQPDRNQLYTALGQPMANLQVAVSPVTAINRGDWFLMCSDGLWEHFTDQELGLLGCNLRRTDTACKHIHQLALARANGRADNLSSILVFVDDRGSYNG